MKYDEEVIERFWEKVDKNGPTMPRMRTRCWVWTGARHQRGYGYFRLSHEVGVLRAPRVAWELKHGEVPNGFNVLHRCDNPPCVRHLFLGTQDHNMKDMAQKGRGRSGSLPGDESSRAVLTGREVLEIRRLYATDEYLYRELAERFGVHKDTIGMIVRRENWRHL